MRRAAIVLVIGVVMAAFGTGCTARSPANGAAGSDTPPAAGGRQTAADTAATLASLRRIDDLPLYEMNYVGDYDALADVPEPPTATPFGCSLFVASGDAAHPVFGRNFDWQPHAALVLHTTPPDGYASVSIVDAFYAGVTDGDELLHSREVQHKLLQRAPLLPFDGMNARGLAVGLAADDSARVRVDPTRKTVSGVRIIRLLLDHAATVAEAVTIIGRYNLNFADGPPLHYLLADASGDSAVVEFVDGRMTVTHGHPPWQALTNFRLAGSAPIDQQSDWRYAAASEKLAHTGGTLDWRGAMALLQNVAQPHTRWSVTYELRSGAVHVVTARRWTQVHTFALAR